METGEDKAMGKNGKVENGAKLPEGEASLPPSEEEPSLENQDGPRRADVPLRPGPDLILDERLTSAAAPFLYLLAIILIAVAGYFVYVFLHG
jgi:hypothetical protein